MSLQINRRYWLNVGDVNAPDALLITDHQVVFDISRTADNSQRTNSASIEIYNLNEDELAKLESEFIAAEFKVGFEDDESLHTIFSGQVVRCTTKKSGPDRITQIVMGEGYVDMTQTPLSSSVPPGKTVKDAVNEIKKAMGIKKGSFSGTNLNYQLLYGLPLSGNPITMLNKLCSTYNLQWHKSKDGKTLVVQNKDSYGKGDPNEAPVVSSETGLIDDAFLITGDKGKKAVTDKSALVGASFKKLIDVKIDCGQIIKLEDRAIDGWFVVDSIRYVGDYRGGDWYMDCRCTQISKLNISRTQSIIAAERAARAKAESLGEPYTPTDEITNTIEE